ncbi:HTH domain-containing protein [Nocardia higoensis]|uniref:HTH domain-containing protein n=1 Tax=Nocardia higoensis TaxID=228599 RepID=A0ABS0D7N4_9NOCA|nr:HTH domain-containing protein [Nocardia higoensis]
MAARANVSVKTVRRDIAALRELLDVGSRAGLVAAARMLHLA